MKCILNSFILNKKSVDLGCLQKPFGWVVGKKGRNITPILLLLRVLYGIVSSKRVSIKIWAGVIVQ